MKHEFNTPDTPQTGTTMVERSWGPLSEKARVHLIESGLKKRYYFYAMEYAADCMNLLGGSESNKMEPGQAPDATLGLNYDLGALVPFGSSATLTTKSEAKNADVTKEGIMLGLNQSGKGCRVLLRDGTIVTSALVTIKPNSQAQRERLASLRRDPSLADAFEREHYHLDEGPESFGTITKAGLRDLNTTAEEQALPHKMPVATVGAQPGHAGHPAQLLPRAPPTAAKAPKVAPLVKDDVAKVEIASARAAGLHLRWAPNPKRGLSAERYALYSAALTFAQFDTDLHISPQRKDRTQGLSRGFGLRCRTPVLLFHSH